MSRFAGMGTLLKTVASLGWSTDVKRGARLQRNRAGLWIEE